MADIKNPAQAFGTSRFVPTAGDNPTTFFNQQYRNRNSMQVKPITVKPIGVKDAAANITAPLDAEAAEIAKIDAETLQMQQEANVAPGNGIVKLDEGTAFKPQVGESNWYGGTDNLTPDQNMANSMQMSAEEFGTWKTENSLDYKNSAQAGKLQAEQANLEATPWTDYASAASSGLGALTGVASYFDNKKMQKKQMAALDTNIAIAKEEQAHRRDFRSNTKSAFA